MIWICVFLIISDVEHISCACGPSVCYLWENVCSDPLPIFLNQFGWDFVVDLYEFFIYFEY